MRSSHRLGLRHVPAPALAAALAQLALGGCTRHDASPSRDTAGVDSAARGAAAAVSTASTPTGTSPAPAVGDTIVRGTLAKVSDTALTLTSAAGDVRVALVAPVLKYTREPATLGRVTEHTFIGVTSVPQPDGTLRATEIHLFPEALRGLGEGSRPMGSLDASEGARANTGGGARTMTNGTVRSTMTNGTVAAWNAARMTNGAVRAQMGDTLTVEYARGSQRIAVPPDVPVAEIVPTTAPLRVGANVVVVATKRADGRLQSSRVLLAPTARKP